MQGVITYTCNLKGESAMFVFQTIIEIILAAFVIWAVFHEDAFVEFEEKLFKKLKAKICEIKRKLSIRVIK